MFSSRQAKVYCCEDVQRIEGYIEASQSKENYDIHHRFEEMGLSSRDLINLGMYYNRPACELLFMLRTEHTKMHKQNVKNCFDQISKFTEWSRNAWKTQEHRKKQKEGLQRVQSTEEYHRNLSISIRHSLSTPEARKKRSDIVKKQWCDSNRRNKASKATSSLWKDPEYRNKVVTNMKKTQSTPEYIQKITAFNQAKAKDPIFLAKLKIARDNLSKLYKQYKNNGGILSWNQWRTYHSSNSKEGNNNL